MASPRPLALFAVLSLLGATTAACGEIGEPDYGLDEGTTTTEAAAGSLDPDEPEVSLLAESAVLAAEVFTPPRPDDYVPALLGATAEGNFLLIGDGSAIGTPDFVAPRRLSEPLGSLNTRRVVDDFFGGLVVQDGTDRLFWYSDAVEAPALLAEDANLLDVGFLDATSQVFVFVNDIVAADDLTTIDRIRLADNERLPFTVLGEGETLIDLSAGDGVQAAALGDEECGKLVFFDAVGQRVDLGGPGEPDCPVVRRPAFGSVALNSDATEVAYTEVTYRSDGIEASTDLVIASLGSSQERFRVTVGEPGQTISGLWFDGDRLVFLRSDDTESVGVLLDPTAGNGGVVVPFGPAPSEVAFSRQPLAAGW